jgi:aryl-alcohol dehydrogenase-like predicted oxidoreductase
MTKADIPAKFAPWNEIWQQWTQWLTGPDVSSVQACLAFPLSFPEIDRVVVGVDSVNQLVQILSASSSTLISELPDLRCDDENLINPANWSTL